MAESKIPQITIEGADLGFRNFSGKEKTFNAAGKRTAVIFLDPEIAKQFELDGWNVKYLSPRDDQDDPKPYLSFEASYRHRPPTVVLLTSGGRTPLGEEDINILDFADIQNVDIVLNPYEWEVGEKQGVKAYLRTLFVTIREDLIEAKYRDIPNAPQSAQNLIGSGYDDENVIAVY